MNQHDLIDQQFQDDKQVKKKAGSNNATNRSSDGDGDAEAGYVSVMGMQSNDGGTAASRDRAAKRNAAMPGSNDRSPPRGVGKDVYDSETATTAASTNTSGTNHFAPGAVRRGRSSGVSLADDQTVNLFRMSVNHTSGTPANLSAVQPGHGTGDRLRPTEANQEDAFDSPLPADLVPDTDELVRRAIEQDRATRGTVQYATTSSVVHADPVVLADDPLSPSDKNDGDRAANKTKYNRLQLCAIVFCICFAIVAISLGVALSRDGDDGNSNDGNAAGANNESIGQQANASTAAPTDVNAIGTTPSAPPTDAPSRIITLSQTNMPSNNPTLQPSQLPTVSDYTQAARIITQRLDGEDATDISIFFDPDSPQAAALDWLMSEPEFNMKALVGESTLPFAQQLVLERYAAAVFYFSTGGDGWIQSHNFFVGISHLWMAWRSHRRMAGRN